MPHPILNYLCWCLLMGCLSLSAPALAQVPLQIERGVLDLREVNLEDTTFYLEGSVIFHWQGLKLPNDSSTFLAGSAGFQEFPQVWTNMDINGQKPGAKGYGTYAFKILLNPANAQTDLGFYIQDMYSAYRLFLNGQEVASNGVVAKTAEAYVPYWLPQVVEFRPGSDTVEVVLQVANFDHSKGGISDHILLGKADIVTAKFQNDQTFDYVLAASLLVGGLFFLGLFFFGREGRTLLYFSLFCFLFSYRIVGSVDYGLHYLIPDLSWYLSIRLEYLDMLGIGFAYIKYTRHLYPEDSSKLIINTFVVVVVALLTVTLLAPVSLFTQFPPIFTLLILLFIPYSLWVFLRAVFRKRPGAWFSLASLVFMFITYTIDAMDFYSLGPRENLLYFFGMILFFFLQSLVLTYRFAFSYKQALSQAHEASRAKSDFLSVMSHEIRTPLNAVVGMSNLLETERPKKENIRTLKHAAQNLLVLVNNLLDYTKIDTGKVEFEALEVPIRDLIRKLVLIHQPEADRSEIELRVSIDGEVPPYIICDPTRLTQVLSNLLSNGLKFTHKGAVELNVTCLERGEQAKLRFEVSDTGIGIPTEKQEMIFDAFTQASPSVTRNYGGTGLGIPIMSKLLALQGSELYLESEVDRGSRFWFDQSFAIGDGSQQESLQKDQSKNQTLIAGKRILLVEDNPVNVVVARKFLERWQVVVSVANSGEEALEMQESFDLVLMDLQMPDIDGYELTRILRAKGVDIPILAFTASALNDAKQRILDAGMNDHIMKPFDPEELYQKLVKHLNQPLPSGISAPKAQW